MKKIISLIILLTSFTTISNASTNLDTRKETFGIKGDIKRLYKIEKEVCSQANRNLKLARIYAAIDGEISNYYFYIAEKLCPKNLDRGYLNHQLRLSLMP